MCGNSFRKKDGVKIGKIVNFFIIVFVLTVTGTTMNYYLDDKINNAAILFPGVGCFLVAVCLGSCVHASNAADNKEKLKSLPSDYKYTSYLHTYK